MRPYMARETRVTIVLQRARMFDHRSKPTSASPWVQRFIVGAPVGGAMLDIACGSGRHLRAGLERGLSVAGIDRDLSGVADLQGKPGVELIEADIEAGDPLPLGGRAFDIVVVTNY